MTDNETRKAILKALYEENRKRPGWGGIGIDVLKNVSGITDEESIDYHLDYLTDRGFLVGDTATEKIITAKGIDFVEGPSEFNPPQAHLRQSIEISGGNIGQINQAHTLTNPSLFLGRLAEAIENHPDLDRKKRQSWKETLLEMSKHPALVELLRSLMASRMT
jgi:hypothetical protein